MVATLSCIQAKIDRLASAIIERGHGAAPIAKLAYFGAPGSALEGDARELGESRGVSSKTTPQ